MSSISEINKDTFWELIAQAKEQCGQDQDAFCQWLEDRLIEMGPEQALNFDYAAFAYRAAAYKYGLWSAASVMLDGCTDDGFTDFRGWLIAQGRDVYMAALKDPDSLADVPVYGDCCFETICYVGSYAYEELTGRNTYEDFDPAVSRAWSEKIEPETGTVIYGYLWDEKREHWLVDEEAAAVVRRIFAMTLAGYGPYQIATRLTQDKVEIPSVHLARFNEGVNRTKPVKDIYGWGSSTIVHILKKREYLGHTVNFKTRKHFKDKKSH